MMVMDYLDRIKYVENPPIERFRQSAYWIDGFMYQGLGVYKSHYTKIAIL